MLVDQLFKYEIISNSEATIEAKVEINADHPLFEGHFPGQPVTPGVLQLQMVKELLEEGLNKSLELSTIGRCRFLAIWNPSEHKEGLVHIQMKAHKDGETSISASGSVNETKFFKFSASYK
mgnify:CR=1 FL=1